MPLIQVTPEHLHRQANTVRNYRKDHEDYMAKLRRLIYSLDESWKGEAQSAFVEKFQSMESVYKKFSQVLAQYADLMDKTASEIQSTDQNIRSMINNI